MSNDNTTQPLLDGDELSNGVDAEGIGRSKTALPRELQERHLIFITLSAVIGMGFFVREGTVEAIGGPGAVIIAAVLNGLVAVAVNQDLARMLQLWPIRSAHVACVQSLANSSLLMNHADLPDNVVIQEFLGKDLGRVAGWLYWITHCCCFAALSATVGDLVASLWRVNGVFIVVLFAAILTPVVINLMDIHYLKQALLFLATVKAAIVVALFFIMLWINPVVAHTHRNRAEKRETVFHYTGPGGVFGALGVAIFALCSAYVGIESIAALAMEADVEPSDSPSGVVKDNDPPSLERGTQIPQTARTNPLPDKDLFSRPAVLVPIIAMVTYVASGWIVTENIDWTDDRLPTLDGRTNASHSSFINSARDRSEVLGAVVTVFMIVIAASTAATTLYVASRALYGMALIHSGKTDGTSGIINRVQNKVFSLLSSKSRFNVPWIAVLVSALIPSFFPFMKHVWPGASGPAIHCIIELGTVSCVFVWGCECMAHWRLLRCLRRNQELPALTGRIDPGVMQLVNKTEWYYFHVVLSFGTACVCFAIIVGGVVITYLHNPTNWQWIPTASLVVLVLGGTLVPKLKTFLRTRQISFAWTDLHDDGSIKNVFQSLRDQRTANYGILRRDRPKTADIFGIVDSEWVKDLWLKLVGR